MIAHDTAAQAFGAARTICVLGGKREQAGIGVGNNKRQPQLRVQAIPICIQTLTWPWH
jgi:hypothetical protein